MTMTETTALGQCPWCGDNPLYCLRACWILTDAARKGLIAPPPAPVGEWVWQDRYAAPVDWVDVASAEADSYARLNGRTASTRELHAWLGDRRPDKPHGWTRREARLAAWTAPAPSFGGALATIVNRWFPQR